MGKNSNPLPTVSVDSPSTAFFWDRHAPLPSLTMVKLQAFHFPNQKGIKQVLYKIPIDLL